MKFLTNILSEKTLTALKAKLGEDLVSKIDLATGDFAIDVAEEKFIPKHKFDEVNNLLKDSKAQIDARDKQITDLGTKAKGNEELTNQINALKTENEKAALEYNSKLLAREREFAIDTYLAGQKVRNLKAVKALLNQESIVMSDGKLTGHEEQIKALRTSDAYLFEEEQPAPKNKGGMPPSGTPNPNDEFKDFRGKY